MSKIAIVILNWNGLKWLQQFLPAVISNSSHDNAEIILADNGSTDGSAGWVQDNYNHIRIIRLGKNHGFSAGYNHALEQIESEYYVLLNSDVEVTPGWLSPMTNFMDSHPDVASCQPVIRSFRTRDYFEHAGAAGGFVDKYGYPFCRGRIFDHCEKDTGQYDNEAEIFWSSGACMMVRAEAWKKCRGFDDSFFAHMEEVDLCWRFHLAGFKVGFVPASVVYHVGGGSLPYESAQKTYLNFRNNLFMLYKNLPDNTLHKTLFIRKVLDGIASVVFLLKAQPASALAVLRSHIDYYRNLKLLRGKRSVVKSLTKSRKTVCLVNKSVVFGFYIRGKKTYSSLVQQK